MLIVEKTLESIHKQCIYVDGDYCNGNSDDVYTKVLWSSCHHFRNYWIASQKWVVGRKLKCTYKFFSCEKLDDLFFIIMINSTYIILYHFIIYLESFIYCRGNLHSFNSNLKYQQILKSSTFEILVYIFILITAIFLIIIFTNFFITHIFNITNSPSLRLIVFKRALPLSA